MTTQRAHLGSVVRTVITAALIASLGLAGAAIGTDVASAAKAAETDTGHRDARDVLP